MDIKTEETPEQAKKRKFQAKVQKNQQDYNIKCAELGQARYRLEVLEWETNNTDRTITSLLQNLKEINEKAARYARVQTGTEADAEEQAPVAPTEGAPSEPATQS